MDQEDRDSLTELSFVTSGWCEQDAAVYGRTGLETTGKVVTDEQGATRVAGLLRNEPGALFLQCALFLFARLHLLFFATDPFGIEVYMTQHDSVRQQLQVIEALLRRHGYWQSSAPEPAVFESTQPFCMDTLEPVEWLQWVLIPRMHALLDGSLPLPQAFAVGPYYEVALDAAHPQRDALLAELTQLDALFGDNV